MNKILIIAEAGVNHNGSFELAKKMVHEAKDAGADYVKFQTFSPNRLVSRFAEKAEYQKKATGAEESQLEMLEKLTLSNDDFRDLKDYSDSLGIGFISTPFDLESIDFLNSLNMDFWKIPSGEVTNLPYLEAIARTERKVVMSTGMCDICEIKAAIEVLERNGTKEIELLHCNTQYPTPFEDVNLNAMATIERETNKKVGYSDHTVGIEVSIAAVAMGAHIIEKHFTLDKSMEGPDHKASLNLEELKQMILSIRNIEKAIGSCNKVISPSEQMNVQIARKSIVASQNIVKGEFLSSDNITVKRPGNGISPMRWYEVIGTTAIHDFREDELIEI